MALFGLSPLFLSLIASNFFSNPDTGLEVVRFLAFMAILSGSIHAFGVLSLRVLPPSALVTLPGTTLAPDTERDIEPNEQSRLLPGKPPGDVLDNAVQDNSIITAQEGVITIDTSGSSVDLLRDPYFWLLCATMVLTVGAVRNCSPTSYLPFDHSHLPLSAKWSCPTLVPSSWPSLLREMTAFPENHRLT